MSEKRKCLCCGKEYDYCPNCGKASTPWKFNFDTEACKELFNIISAYNMKIANDDAIQKILDKYSITDFSIYKENIKNILNSLKKRHNKIENNKVQNDISVDNVIEEENPNIQENEIQSELIINPVEEENQRINRRRNRFFD